MKLQVANSRSALAKGTLAAAGLLAALAFGASVSAAPRAATSSIGTSPFSTSPETTVPQDGDEESFDDMSLDELVERMGSERDDVDTGVIKAVAAKKNRAAVEALLEAYDNTFASIYMRRAVLRQLSVFDDVDDAFEPALERLATVVGESDTRELRESALESLGKAPQHGRTFLALIVDSAAQDDLRERALELHIQMGGEEDHDWYRTVFERDSKKVVEMVEEKADELEKANRRRRGDDEEPEKVEIAWSSPRLRVMALRAIAPSMDEKELETIVEKDESGSVRGEALLALSRQGSDDASDLAKDIAESVQYPASYRTTAAEIWFESEGADAARDLIDLALKNTSPETLRQKIADLLSGLGDEDVDKRLTKLVGRGKAPEQAFAIRATRHIDDEKMVRKIRKGLRSRDVPVQVATIHALAERRDEESIEDMEKLLEREDEPEVRQALLQGLSKVYDGSNDWVDRLVAFTASADLDLRNAAINEIARLGRDSQMDLFVGLLGHADWSTRFAALNALERLREPEVVAPIVEQMQSETGRMAVEFGETLFRLTGESFGKRGATWKRWLDDQTEEIELIAESKIDEIVAEKEEERLKQLTSANFFGIRIESHRVLFIVDVSGSMSEPMRSRYVGETGRPRIDVAKEELSKAVEALENNALFNILAFSSGVETWLEEGVTTSKSKTRDEALEYVDRLGAFGGTNLYGALRGAFEDEDIDTIFVLSDGEPSVGELIDPQLIREAVQEMNQTRGVVINTIAIGGSLEVLEWLAEDSGGTHVGMQ